jgi:hypothetical protein
VSDDGIIWKNKLALGFTLLLTFNNFEVKTEVLTEGPHVAGLTQELRGGERIQDLVAATAQLARQAEEQAHGPEYPYEAEQPQTVDQVREQFDSWEHKLDDLDHETEDLEDTAKQLTEGSRRDESQALLELQQARQAALDELLESQKRDDAEKHKENAGFRKDLAERHAGSPSQEMYLQKFDDVVVADKNDRDDKYAGQVRELDEHWQEKFKELDMHPLTIPTVPDHDRDDDDKQR